MADLIDSFELVVQNVEQDLCTYQRDEMGSSNIDVTLSSRGMVGRVSKWKVVEATDSDHRALCFEVTMQYSSGIQRSRTFNLRKPTGPTSTRKWPRGFKRRCRVGTYRCACHDAFPSNQGGSVGRYPEEPKGVRCDGVRYVVERRTHHG